METENLDPLALLAISAYVAWQNTIAGSPTPAQRTYFERMGTPVVGDLVCEVSNWGRPPTDRIGRLLSITHEPYPDWEEHDAPAPTRPVWTLRTLAGRDVRWENCTFVVVPENPWRHQGKHCRAAA